MKLRIRFSKHGNVRYIGHLDIQRYFQRLNRRAGLKVVYSEGFSPHQKMSFAMPLSVGYESDAEYCKAYHIICSFLLVLFVILYIVLFIREL